MQARLDGGNDLIAVGRYAFSSTGEKGTGTLGAPMRWMGAFSVLKQAFWTVAATSAPKPAQRFASCTTTRRPVLLTDLMTVSASKGRMERRSTTSALMPSFSSSSAAFRASFTMAE